MRGTLESRLRIKHRTMTTLLTRVDSVLTNSDVRVGASTEGPGENIAYTETETGDIYLNFDHEFIRNETGNRQYGRILGINYHELGHNLFTKPFNGWKSEFENAAQNARVVTSRVFSAWNILEDGRIERLVSGMFPGVAPMLRSVVYGLLDYTANQGPVAVFMLAAPRKWLIDPDLYRKLRADAVQSFTEVKVLQAESIVAKYLPLILPMETSSAISYSVAYAKLFENHMRSSKDMTGEDLVGTTPGSPRRPHASQKMQEEAGANAKEAEKEQAAQEKQAGKSSGQSGKKGGKSGKGDGAGTEETGESKSGNTPGQGAGTTPGLAAQAIQAAQEENEQDTDFLDAMNSFTRQMRGTGTFRPAVPYQPIKPGLHTPAVTIPMRKLSKQIAQEFQRLQGNLDPGWEEEQPSGMLNLRRFQGGAPLSEAFDEWREDLSSAADVEIALILDTSGSMASRIESVAQQCWVLRSALQSIGAKVWVYTFGADTNLRMRPTDKANAERYEQFSDLTGSTLVLPAITEAISLFSRSHSKVRLAVFITDGAYGETYQLRIEKGRSPYASAMEDLGTLGVYRMVFGLGLDTNWEKTMEDYHEFILRVGSYDTMIQPVRQAVKGLIRMNGGR